MRHRRQRFQKCVFFVVLSAVFDQISCVIPCTEENGLYECDSGKCIPFQWLCDSKSDCPEGDDEVHASCGERKDRGDCGPFQFQCEDVHSGLPKCSRPEWRCDGFVDCRGGIDEENCEAKPTPMRSLFGQPTPPPSRPNSTMDDDGDSPSVNDGVFAKTSFSEPMRPLLDSNNASRNASSSAVPSNAELAKNFTFLVGHMLQGQTNVTPPKTLNVSPTILTTSTTRKMQQAPLITVKSATTTTMTTRPASTSAAVSRTPFSGASLDRVSTSRWMPAQTSPWFPLITIRPVSFVPSKSGADSGTTVKPFVRPTDGTIPDNVPPFVKPLTSPAVASLATSSTSPSTRSSTPPTTSPSTRPTTRSLTRPSASPSTHPSTRSPPTRVTTPPALSTISPPSLPPTVLANSPPNPPVILLPATLVNIFQPFTRTAATSPAARPPAKYLFSSDVDKSSQIRDTSRQQDPAPRPQQPAPSPVRSETPIVPSRNFQVLIPLHSMDPKTDQKPRVQVQSPAASDDSKVE